MSDFDLLCHINVLEVKENVYKMQLKKSEWGWYETGLVWTENKLPLSNNKLELEYSLNHCLEKAPSLQNILWDILIKTRFRPVISCANIEKSFYQIHIKEKERESLKFHWIENLTNNTIRTLRFTRPVNQPPYTLEGTLQTHFESYENMHL